MEYDLIDVGPCRKKLVLKFTEKDTDAAFDESYREINDYVQLKGFRKGKAPRATLEKRFKSEAAAGAKRYLTDKNLGEVVKAADIKALGDIVDKNPDAVPDQHHGFTMEIELDVMPEFELPQYKGLELAAHPVEVADEAIDAALERYRKMFANYTPVEEPAELGDVLKVDFLAKIEDEEVMNMKEQRLRVEGEILFGLPCPDLVEKFKGAKAGDTVQLTINMPDDHQNPDLRGRPALIEVKVNGVERGDLPALDDAFASGLGMNTLKDFRERIRANLIREAMMDARAKQEKEIVEKLLGAVQFDAPVGMVNSETNALEDQQRMRLERAGIKGEEVIKERLDKFHPEAAAMALEKVKWGIMAQKIGEKENITVTQDDMAAQIEALAQSYKTTPAKVIQRIREFDGVAPMMQEILSIKVMQFIVDSAKGGRLDPENKGKDTESVNADAAEVAKSAEAFGSEGKGEGSGCSCGHDHGDGHNHSHEH